MRVVAERVPSHQGEAFRNAVDASGMTCTAVADAMGVARPKLYEYFAGSKRINSDLIRRMPKEVRRHYINEWLCRDAGLMACDAPTPADIECDVGHLQELVEAHSAMVSKSLDAFRDRRIDRQEAAPLAKLFRRLKELAAAGEQRMDLVVRNGVDGVRASVVSLQAVEGSTR